MKILVVTLGSIGDLLPFIVVGTALRDRGHDVIFASNAGYETVVRGAGFAFHPIWDRAPSQPTLDDVLASDPDEAWRRVQHHLFAAAEKPTFDFIARAAERGKSVILASWSAQGAVRAHVELGIPLARAYLSPRAIAEDTAFPSGGRACRLAFFPEWFCPRQSGWLDVALTGFPMFEDSLLPALPPELQHFLADGESPVVITPGSFARGAATFLRDSLAACAALEMRAVLLTPYIEQIPAPLPKSAIHFKYVSLQRLMGRAAALVCHGGIGTLAQGLKAGIPQLVIPAFFDQSDNGRHIERLGTGAAIAPNAYSANEAADKLIQLLRSKTVKSNCARIRDQFSGESPVGEICERVESLV